MPTYNPADVERRWQNFWETHKTFRTPDPDSPEVAGKKKFYVLDMFPYPSGSGLHVGHPEGYTATDILARFRRMRGDHVLHPMGWDAFGLPAEQHAITTGEHPSINTRNNINNFRRQIKSLGFSYDWDREVDTTDPSYVKWTQWIFLLIHDTWYDPEAKKGRPISELPIPPEIQAQGEAAVREFQDSHRLAYQSEVPVNWCPALGTVLANEEVIDGKSERGNHPVVRMPLRQWQMRITAYAERLLSDLDPLDWSESIKDMQRNWIGKSEGAEVHFTVAGYDATITVFTTRPDTLFGATYMVLAPEHPLVDRVTTPEQRESVQSYRETAARKSDFERTELAKTKTGVFTGAFAINPVNGEKIPVWIADYVLASYGTGAIMAVPAHDERDFAFAKQFGLPIRQVVEPDTPKLPKRFLAAYREYFGGSTFDTLYLAPDDANGTLRIKLQGLSGAKNGLVVYYFDEGTVIFAATDNLSEPIAELLNGRTSIGIALNEAMDGDGVAINSGMLDGMQTAEAKRCIIAWLIVENRGDSRINYKLRDWLFSRQRYWGEPFPLLHEIGADGKPTGAIRRVAEGDLPVTLPEMADFKPTGSPEGPLVKATEWMNVTIDGKQYRRETNTMPQWAGSCWYYLRYIDPHNSNAFADPAKLKHWLPVDLYVGGAEHAVLHLLYSRFWHKVLYDRGYVHCPEPFHRLVNQGMILGEYEYHISVSDHEKFQGELATHCIRATLRETEDPKKEDTYVLKVQSPESGNWVDLPDDLVVKEKGKTHLLDPRIAMTPKAEKMSKSRGNVVNPDDVIRDYGADSLRLYEMFMGPLEAVKPWSSKSVGGVSRFLNRVWRLIVDDASETVTVSASVQDVAPDLESLRILHRTIKKVTEDTDGLRFNTAISTMMEFTNHYTTLEIRPRSALETFVLLLAPYAPHIAEELWAALGHTQSLAYEPWPKFDPALTTADEVEVPVQIGGKVRARLMLPAGTDEKAIEAAALADSAVKEAIAGRPVKKVIVANKGKIVNIVV